MSSTGVGGPERVMEALRSVYDPCCAEREISIVDMGLIRSVSEENAAVRVELMLTSGWCPFAANIVETIRQRLTDLDGVDDASVEITWDEAWTMDRLSDGARRKLVFLPDPIAAGDRSLHIHRARAGIQVKGGAPDDR